MSGMRSWCIARMSTGQEMAVFVVRDRVRVYDLQHVKAGQRGPSVELAVNHPGSEPCEVEPMKVLVQVEILLVQLVWVQERAQEQEQEFATLAAE
jgi:hypothetical protein